MPDHAAAGPVPHRRLRLPRLPGPPLRHDGLPPPGAGHQPVRWPAPRPVPGPAGWPGCGPQALPGPGQRPGAPPVRLHRLHRLPQGRVRRRPGPARPRPRPVPRRPPVRLSARRLPLLLQPPRRRQQPHRRDASPQPGRQRRPQRAGVPPRRAGIPRIPHAAPGGCPRWHGRGPDYVRPPPAPPPGWCGWY